MWTLAGFVYVAFVVDVFSRRILGWRVTTTKHTAMVTDALRQALQVRHRSEQAWTAVGLVHHSDAGSQGGFNRSSQHLDLEVSGGTSSGLGDSCDGAAGDAVAWASAGGSA
jgi:putative transposase